MSQTILITGASSGFGLLVATKLHESGHKVIGTSLTPEKDQPNVPFKLLGLDIGDDASIGAFGKELWQNISKLDVLINNAGYFLTGLAEETTMEQAKRQLDINFWGTVKVTNELLPHFRKQRSGKIITVSSIMGLVNLPSCAYYGASKHALEGFFKTLRFELFYFNIKVCMIEPTSFKTNIISNSVKAEKRIADYDDYRQTVEAFSDDLFNNSPGPEKVVNKLLKLVETENPTFNHPIGKDSSVLVTLQFFAYKLYEKILNKDLNKFKINK